MAELVEDDEEDAAASHHDAPAPAPGPAGGANPVLRRAPTDGNVRVVLASDLTYGLPSASSRDLAHFASAAPPPVAAGAT